MREFLYLILLTLSDVIQEKDKKYREHQLLALWLKSILNQERYEKLPAQLNGKYPQLHEKILLNTMVWMILE